MRALAVRALVTVAAGAAIACHGGEENASPTHAAPDPLLEDRRLQEILGGCTQLGFYDRDLSDLAPILLEKLERARPDPLKRAKEELGHLGVKAFPALANAFHGSYTDMMRSAFLENIVDALAFSSTEEAHELLLEALQHPQESVRSKCLDGLARLARPSDFDILVERLPIETRELRRQTVAALFQADRARAEDFFAGALEAGQNRDLWLNAVPELARTESRAEGERCGALFPLQDALLASYLAAAAARHGDPRALEHLRAEVRHADLQRRLAAVQAVQRAGMIDELLVPLLEDVGVEVRAIAASAIGQSELTEERRAALRAALNDVSEVVRGEALSRLCAHGDSEGLTLAVSNLQLDGPPLQSALLALRGPLRSDRALAERVLAQLLERHTLEEHRPLTQRASTFKAIGQVPLREAAAFLHERGVEAGEDKIESLRAHDWLMIQAANTEAEGRGYLAEILPAEGDPLRRLDLIDAVGSARDELARRALLDVAENATLAPLERLFAAYGAIRVGPSSEVAPRLKRVAFGLRESDESLARKGLQCLLWIWY